MYYKANCLIFLFLLLNSCAAKKLCNSNDKLGDREIALFVRVLNCENNEPLNGDSVFRTILHEDELACIPFTQDQELFTINALIEYKIQPQRNKKADYEFWTKLWVNQLKRNSLNETSLSLFEGKQFWVYEREICSETKKISSLDNGIRELCYEYWFEFEFNNGSF